MSGGVSGKMVRIVHYYRDLVRPSGVTVAIEGWQEALIAAGIESIAFHSGDESMWKFPNISIPHIRNGRQVSVPMLSGYLRAGDVLVIHEGWVISNLAAGAQAKRMGIPYVVMPHGVYEPQILKHLKAPYYLRRVLEAALLKNAMAAHVFYETEKRYVRALAPDIESFVVPTGFKPHTANWIGGGGYLGWFGRYSIEHKGLDRLLASYALVPAPKRLPLRLRGIDYQEGKRAVENLVKSLGISEWITVGGPLNGHEKTEFLQNCDGFIFPSRWESQGIALMEAISMGVPSLVSDSIHAAPSLSEYGAATITDFGDFVGAANEMSKFPVSGYTPERARSYISNSLNWHHIIKKYIPNVDKQYRG